MSDSTRRTIRTVLQVAVAIALMGGLYLVPVLDQVGIDPTSVPGLATFVAICGLVARAWQSGAVERVMEVLGLGKQPDGRHEAA